MSLVISCDSVFNALTRGPFPTGGAEDADVDLHLRACHSCRELAEALRPAVGLFHESLAEEEEAGLPIYRGLGSGMGFANRLTRASTARSVCFRGSVSAIVAGGLIAIVFAAAMWVGSERGERNGLGPSTHRSDISATELFATPLDRESRLLLASLGIPASCFLDPVAAHRPGRLGGAESVAGASAEDPLSVIDCCTRCHFSGGAPRASAAGARVLATACAVCHRPAASVSATGDRAATPLALIFRIAPARAC